MVFSAALTTAPTTGMRPYEAQENPHLKTYPGSDQTPAKQLQFADKHDPLKYTVDNAPLVGLAGLVAGAQEAFYAFNAMPDVEARQTLRQAATLLSIIGKKTLLGLSLGAAFCYTEATVENLRGTHDMWNGMAGGAAAGLLFAMLPPKPMPQPIAWPLAFAAVMAGSDLISEKIPQGMQGFRHWGPMLGREHWNDPEPPRPPVLETGESCRPVLGNFWRNGSYNTADAPAAKAHH